MKEKRLNELVDTYGTKNSKANDGWREDNMNSMPEQISTKQLEQSIYRNSQFKRINNENRVQVAVLRTRYGQISRKSDRQIL